MRIYEGTTEQFVEDTRNNTIADKLSANFESYYSRKASPSEYASWTNSLQFLKNIVEYASPDGNMVALEYELPYSTNRLDCMLFGKSNDGKGNVVIIELKQWSSVKECDIEDNVITFVGGSEKMVPHPSFQVRSYHYYLEDFIELFHRDSSVGLASCVYCHNYPKEADSVLLSPKFDEILKKFPVYTKDDFRKLGDFIKFKIEKGEGIELFGRFITSNIKPSKRLIDVTRQMIDGQNVFYLIDEQLAANNTIIDRAKKCSKLKKKSVIIVNGGPGTGKSVIALNALAELLSKGLVVYHATGSKSFTNTLRKITGPRAMNLFKYFNSFSSYGENDINVLICDEAHRIRKSSNSRFTRNRAELSQIDELIKVAKVVIFFIDDHQVVRSQEIGSSKLIRDAATKFNAEIYDFKLKTQFRCGGSDSYLKWINNVLELEENDSPILTDNDKMDFTIFDDPGKLYDAIKQKNLEKQNSARLVAGFCWPWSDPNPDGTLVEDVVIGNFKIPWEGKDGKKLAKGIPTWFEWAFKPEGEKQCGCIYTVQGFEFEYIGVIFGNDLVYDPVQNKLVGIPGNSKDGMLNKSKEKEFTDYVKNIYRVLLSRGMKGCYVYFVDKKTEDYFKSRMKLD
jgi:hypothetical protein